MDNWYAPIFALYEQGQRNYSDISEHLPRLKTFVDLLKPLNIIECGVRGGWSTIAFLAGLGILPESHLYSVDMADLEEPIRSWKNQIPPWTFVKSVDLPYPTWMPDQAQIIFIDTEHSHSQCSAEIREYSPHLAPNGIMLFHDTDDSGGFGVKRACQDFCGADWKFHNWTNNNGLGVIYRVSEQQYIEGIIEQISKFVRP